MLQFEEKIKKKDWAPVILWRDNKSFSGGDGNLEERERTQFKPTATDIAYLHYGLSLCNVDSLLSFFVCRVPIIQNRVVV